ncbi:uncharacterized protein J3R85_017148 [Psidium guajava]|nr:uncharacterized protein J3R85_017148 [Psidium guajava]
MASCAVDVGLFCKPSSRTRGGSGWGWRISAAAAAAARVDGKDVDDKHWSEREHRR